MPIFEIQQQDKTYEVEAPDLETALKAFNPNFKMPSNEPPPMEEVVVEGQRPMTGMQTAKGASAATGRMMRSVLAQPVAGIVGLLGAAVGGIDKAAAWKEGVEDAIVGAPDTVEEQRVMQDFNLLMEKAHIPQVLQAADDAFYKTAGANDSLNSISAGNPELAAIIKTGIYGLPEILGLKGMNIPKRAIAAKRAIGANRQLAKEVKKQAEDMGLRLTNDELVDSILEAADRLSPTRVRGQGADAVQTGVRDAAKKAEAGIDAARADARKTRAYVPAKEIKELGEDLTIHLVDAGMDVARMPVVKGILQDMKRSTVQVPGDPKAMTKQVRIKDLSMNTLDLLRRRVTEGIRHDGSNQDSALMTIRESLDAHLKDKFDTNAISGDPAAHAKWKEQRKLLADYEAKFDTDETVRRLLTKDGTAEDVVRWAIGTNAQSAKINSAVVVRRIKDILGPNHKGVIAMRNSALKDVLQPLFGDKPNFRSAIKNIDNLLKNNASLASELAIPTDKLLTLRRAAHAGQFVRQPVPAILQKRWLSRLAASLIWGHDLAKRSRIVQLGHKIIDKLIGTGVLQERDIVKHLMAGDDKVPFVDYDTPRMRDFLAGATLADIGILTEPEAEQRDGDIVGLRRQ